MTSDVSLGRQLLRALSPLALFSVPRTQMEFIGRNIHGLLFGGIFIGLGIWAIVKDLKTVGGVSCAAGGLMFLGGGIGFCLHMWYLLSNTKKRALPSDLSQQATDNL